MAKQSVVQKVFHSSVESIPAPRLVKAPKSPKKSKPIPMCDSVIDQAKVAFTVSIIGSIVGIVLGGAVQLTTYFIAHYEWTDVWSIYSVLVLGGLLFSAKSVFFWTRDAFRDTAKALGFVALIEGGMIFSHIQWIGL